MIKKIFISVLFVLSSFNLFSNDVKWTYSVMPSKIFIGDNYLTELTVSNLYKNVYVDMKLSDKLDEDIFYDIMKLAIYYISMSKEVRFELSGVFEENLVIAFSIRESAFKKAKYFVLLSTNYSCQDEGITDDLAHSYCRWYWPVLGELILVNKNNKYVYNSDVDLRVEVFYNRLKNERSLKREFGWIYGSRW